MSPRHRRDEDVARGPERDPNHPGHDDDAPWGKRQQEGFRRSQESGGFGSPYAAWSSGVAGFGFGPEEVPGGARGHAGRGPRNYTRADTRLYEDVCDRLTEDPGVDATDIVVEVKSREVTLSGTVASREQKRRAETCAERVAGVADVMNQLRVKA